MKVYIGILLLIFLVVTGCVKKQSMEEEGSIDETIFEEVTTEEDTSTIVFEESSDTSETSTSLLEDLEPEPPAPEESVERQGYRVQIGAFGNEAAADKYAAKARQQLSKKVYVKYIAPYYKVHVGNFLDRYEATQYKNQLRSTLFEGAFVVESKIVME